MFDNLVPGNSKAAADAIKTGRLDVYICPPDKLRVLPGFNVREKGTERYEARVEWLTNSIIENGYYRDQPLGGYAARVDGEDVIYVTKGHRRHEAVMRAIERGHEIEGVPVMLQARGTSIEALTVDLVVGNEGEPLTMYECGVVCARLVGYGWDSAKIAAKLGYSSPQHVDNLLLLAGAPLSVRQMVINDVVSATTAIATLKKHGDKAAEVLAKAQAATVGGKVKPRNLPEVAFKKAVVKQAPALFDLGKKIAADPGFASLSEDLRKALAEVLEKVK